MSKVYKVWAEKIQRSYLSWHWTVMQTLNEPWPCGLEWHEELGELSLEHSKVWKIVYSSALLVHSISCFSQKISGKLCVMTLKGDEKFERKLTHDSKNEKMIWWIFMQAVKILKVGTFIGFFCQKHIKV